MGDFFAFRRLITLPVIRVLYVVGVIAITSFVIDQAIAASKMRTSVMYMDSLWTIPARVPMRSPWLTATFRWGIAQIVWRLACEGVVVFFSIHERLKGIEERSGGGDRT